MQLQQSDIATTKMTSKGQVVIPEEIRDSLHLEPGAKFIVIAAADSDSIVFKKINPPAMQDINKLLKASQKIAKEHRFTRQEIDDTVKEVRAANRKSAPKKSKK